MKEKFYRNALPTQGVYCATGITVGGRAANRFANSLTELINLVESMDRAGEHVFVALHSFNGESRKADDAVLTRSVVIDLDVHPTKPKRYRSKEEALASLRVFLNKYEFPEPTIVDSGGGYHAYWFFDTDVPSAEWLPYAEKFKAVCLKDMLIDPVVTADRARIMRAPGTRNFKFDPPVPVRLFTNLNNLNTISFISFREFLDDVQPGEGIDKNNKPSDVLASVEKGIDDDTRSVATIDPNLETSFTLLAQRSVDHEGGCQQIDYILRNAASLDQPLWHSGLSIARACVDWETAIHEMSCEYPGYDAAKTLKKAHETYNKPHSCTVFEERNPGGCDGCPHRGKITNPLALGRQLRHPTTPSENAIRSDENPEEVPVYTEFPESLKPFRRGPTGGVWYDPPAKQNTKGDWIPQRPMQLWAHDLYPIKRMYGAHGGEAMQLRHIMPRDDVRDFLLPMSAGPDVFREILSKHGVLVHPTEVPLMLKYIQAWGLYMQRHRTAEQTRMQMGWTEDCNGFVVGSVEYRRDGKVIKTAASPLVHSIEKLLRPFGSYQEWRNSAQKLDRPGFEMHAFAMLLGFGSPILRLTPVKGVSIGLIGSTGCGKSGAMFAGASLFGDPYELSLAGAKKGSTENALIQWYMGLKNIMMGLDEASNYKPEDLSDLFYKVTQGKNKVRMQQSANAVREIEQTASLITVLTSNQSLIDKVVQFKANPDGELARYIELYVKQPRSLTAETGLEIFDPFRTNYGHAGPEYVKYLFKVGDVYISEKIRKWGKRFLKSAGNDPAYRFYEAAVNTAMAGGELAKEAGIVEIDLERVYATIMSHIISLNEDTTKRADYKAILGEFQNQNLQNVVIVNDSGLVIATPRGPLVARVEMATKMYYVSKSVMRTYLTKQGREINLKDFIASLKEEGICTYDGRLRLSNGMSGMSGTNAVTALGFKDVVPAELLNQDAPRP